METATTLRVRSLTAIATGLATGLLVGAPAASASEGVVDAAVGESAQEVREYWTPQRMRKAEPATSLLERRSAGRSAEAGARSAPQGGPIFVDPRPAGDPRVPLAEAGIAEEPVPQHHAEANRDEITDTTAAPFRTHGRVFFTLGGSPYTCSATSVSANNRSVVWTAGHCVYDRDEGGFATKWMFAPGYRNGNSPFGRWPARRLATTPQWRSDSSFKYDLGAAVVRTDGSGRTLAEVVGSRGIAFNQPRDQQYQVFGYPADVPFDGQRMYRCSAPYGGADNPGGPGPSTMYVACDMNSGSSGGGWVADGRVLSVISYKYLDDVCYPPPLNLTCEMHVYGPYQESVAAALYRSVRGQRQRCGGLDVTHLGTAGDDVIFGTAGPDVIKALGGDDVIRGRGGRDRICAGGGDDVLRGGPGNDRLRGGAGNDRLLGGKGRRDVCNGGSGRDRARGCEITRRIP